MLLIHLCTSTHPCWVNGVWIERVNIYCLSEISPLLYWVCVDGRLILYSWPVGDEGLKGYRLQVKSKRLLALAPPSCKTGSGIVPNPLPSTSSDVTRFNYKCCSSVFLKDIPRINHLLFPNHQEGIETWHCIIDGI